MPKAAQRLLADAINAVEAFVNLAMIATGLLQLLAIEHAENPAAPLLVDADLFLRGAIGRNGEDGRFNMSSTIISAVQAHCGFIE